ncbi:Rne/Rng family ribonuclease [Brachybacterium sp. AOP25-B2-12]|uniref:Rne/Rng family ribonuclease n=1 Tax=Brachybacterium sp. AOP25-B2-12 TaxID=3457710 RepID=UPI004033E0DD
MAEDSRTPEHAEDTTETDAPTSAPPRRRRRAGAPTGAPAVHQEAEEQAPHAPLTSVPEQESTAPVAEAEPAPTTRPKRRRSGAPAGPPVAPVFSAAHDPVPAAPTPEDDEDEDADDEEAPTPAAEDQHGETGGIADDLAALSRRRAVRSRATSEDEDRSRRAQLDFSSLLFQAPDLREEADSDADTTDASHAGTVDDAEGSPRGERSARGGRGSSAARRRRSEDTDSSDDTEGSGPDDDSDDEGGSSRRRRRRGGRGRRGRGRGDDESGTDERGEDHSEQRADARSDDDEDSGETSDHEASDDAREDDGGSGDGQERSGSRRSRSRGGRRGKGGAKSSDDSHGSSEEHAEHTAEDSGTSDETSDDDRDDDDSADGGSSSSRRRRRRRRSSGGGEDKPSSDDPPNTVVKVRDRRDEVKAVKGSTRLEAKKQRRREGRDAGRRRNVITEAEFLARRESVKRSMIVRERPGRTQIAVLEDDVLVEHYVAQRTQSSMVGNVFLGKVQNVLPSMEAAFVDIGKGRNAVLYAGEVNWDAAGLSGQPRRIELALKSGDPVLVQVTKDPIGHKGARLTSQISLPGRYVVFVPGGSMTGISRKLPDTERSRLKKIMKKVIPEGAGVIVRTASEGASEEALTHDVERLRAQWDKILKAQKSKSAPASLAQEPDLAIKVVRDVFNEDFTSLIVEGDKAYDDVHEYVQDVAPDLLERVTRHMGDKDVFVKHRVDEQLLKAMDRKVYLPSGGSLVIDRTEAMTVVDVNTGKFTGSGGSLEETVTRNNLEAAEEIVRQLRLRDIGGIIVVDFIDMVLEANRDLVVRRLIECLGRDRTKHQVAEVTSLGLVQMTRKRVGQGLVETFSTTCEACAGRGIQIDIDGKHHHESDQQDDGGRNGGSRRRGGRKGSASGSGSAGSTGKDAPAEEPAEESPEDVHRLEEDTTSRELARATIASIAAATTGHGHPEVVVDGQVISVDEPADQAASAPEPESAATTPEDTVEDAWTTEVAEEAPATPVTSDDDWTSEPSEAPEDPDASRA